MSEDYRLALHHFKFHALPENNLKGIILEINNISARVDSDGDGAMRHELDARGYKLLLTPERFSSSPPATVAAFGNEELCPLIVDRLGSRNDGEARHHGGFGSPAERTVPFHLDPAAALQRANKPWRSLSEKMSFHSFSEFFRTGHAGHAIASEHRSSG